MDKKRWEVLANFGEITITSIHPTPAGDFKKGPVYLSSEIEASEFILDLHTALAELGWLRGNDDS